MVPSVESGSKRRPGWDRGNPRSNTSVGDGLRGLRLGGSFEGCGVMVDADANSFDVAVEGPAPGEEAAKG